MAAVTAEPTTSSGGGGGRGDGHKAVVNAEVAGEPDGGGVRGWISRKRRESPCVGGGSRDVMDVDVDMEVEGGRGGEGGEKEGRDEYGGEAGRNITSFSPYAARLGSGASPEDDVGR